MSQKEIVIKEEEPLKLIKEIIALEDQIFELQMAEHQEELNGVDEIITKLIIKKNLLDNYQWKIFINPLSIDHINAIND